MPYTVTITALIEGAEPSAKDASHLAKRLQLSLDRLIMNHGYDLVEYGIEVEDEAMGIKVVASETEVAHDA